MTISRAIEGTADTRLDSSIAGLVLGQMKRILGSPRLEFLLVSHYVVLPFYGTESFVGRASKCQQSKYE